jgi:hypothetical protein
MIPECVRRHDRDRQDLRVAQGGQARALVSQRLHGLVNDHVDRYNQGVVVRHEVAPDEWSDKGAPRQVSTRLFPPLPCVAGNGGV